jgi:hypothetical protein
VRVKRKDGSLFDARLYVSPLIDAVGKQTGWMTSMTDITEPNRIREQLSASYERFTTVLEALDASVSVAPLGSEELLFANKLYRLWFGTHTGGHLQMVARPACPPPHQRRVAGRGGLVWACRPTRCAARSRRTPRSTCARAGQVAGGALALPELGGRPPGADGDCHRHHAAPPCRGAGRRPGRARAVTPAA